MHMPRTSSHLRTYQYLDSSQKECIDILFSDVSEEEMIKKLQETLDTAEKEYIDKMTQWYGSVSEARMCSIKVDNLLTHIHAYPAGWTSRSGPSDTDLLNIAAGRGQTKVVEYLLDLIKPLNESDVFERCQDPLNCIPLYFAIQYQQKPIIELLKAEAPFFQRYWSRACALNGKRLFNIASKLNDDQTIQLLTENGWIIDDEKCNNLLTLQFERMKAQDKLKEEAAAAAVENEASNDSVEFPRQ